MNSHSNLSSLQALPDGEAELQLVVHLRWEDLAALGREASRLAVRLQRPVGLDEAATHHLRSRLAAPPAAAPTAPASPVALTAGSDQSRQRPQQVQQVQQVQPGQQVQHVQQAEAPTGVAAAMTSEHTARVSSLAGRTPPEPTTAAG